MLPTVHTPKVSYIQSHGHWLLFDDDMVEVVSEDTLQHVSRLAHVLTRSYDVGTANLSQVFGSTKKNAGVTETGYILFYQQERPQPASPLERRL